MPNADPFDREAYKQRTTVERCINLKQWRGIATRYEKTAIIYWLDSTSRHLPLLSAVIQTRGGRPCASVPHLTRRKRQLWPRRPHRAAAPPGCHRP